MINITVHHHHNLPHFTCPTAAAASAKCSMPPSIAPVATTRQQPKHNRTSNVEVYYSGPKISQLPLKSNNNSSITNRLAKETDMNNNNNKDIENINHSRNDDDNRSINTQTTAKYCKTDQDIDTSTKKIKHNLHTRSISLIVNPEFSSDSESELALCRRRSLPRLVRRTRLLLAYDQGQQQQHQPMANLEQTTRAVEELDRKLETECSMSELTQETGETSEEAALRQAESCARLRETGAFLREISDEFSKARRRTI